METYHYFLAWATLWTVLLIVPPGSKAINTAYRFNFVHGVLSTVVASLSLLNMFPVNASTMCTISYFFVDFVNNLLNDFLFKVPSYQNPQSRRVEYAHHVFCFFVGVSSQLFYKTLCPMEINPFIYLMFAEFSTPFLMAWRYFGGHILGILFLISFFACRLVYHGLYFIPRCVTECKAIVGYGFSVPYMAMNIYFFVMIVNKLRKPLKKEGKAT